jgi:lysyl endopeptidase
VCPIRFQGSAKNARVFGPYRVATLKRQLYWSPVLEGDTATIEIELPAGADMGPARIVVPTISHLVVAGQDLKQQDPLGAIGSSDSCEIDVACISPSMQQQAATAIGAVARMVLVDKGDTFLCSGTLLNDSLASMTPYFYSANHCIDSGDQDPAASRDNPATVAASIETYWFFEADVCGVDTPAGVNYVVLPGGAQLLGRSVDYDWALLRLYGAPPAGVTFAAWNAARLTAGTGAAGIHHPSGDLKKFSQGTVRGYETERDGSSFITVQWSQGVTEPGSSGSGLFVYNATQDYYELRGGLYGGSSACTPASARSGTDIYSRLDVALPYLAPYLSPAAANPAEALVVEFYNATLDDYFITMNPAEIAELDAGMRAGWARTGLTFLAYTDAASAPADANPVCRFYVPPEVGDSHFYSADPAECAATASNFAGSWIEESAAAFYLQSPSSSGACPANTRPVFRFVSTANQFHHRYTAEVDVRDSIIEDGGWVQEGVGAAPQSSVMCSPIV